MFGRGFDSPQLHGKGKTILFSLFFVPSPKEFHLLVLLIFFDTPFFLCFFRSRSCSLLFLRSLYSPRYFCSARFTCSLCLSRSPLCSLYFLCSPVPFVPRVSCLLFPVPGLRFPHYHGPFPVSCLLSFLSGSGLPFPVFIFLVSSLGSSVSGFPFAVFRIFFSVCFPVCACTNAPDFLDWRKHFFVLRRPPYLSMRTNLAG